MRKNYSSITASTDAGTTPKTKPAVLIGTALSYVRGGGGPQPPDGDPPPTSGGSGDSGNTTGK